MKILVWRHFQRLNLKIYLGLYRNEILLKLAKTPSKGKKILLEERIC